MEKIREKEKNKPHIIFGVKMMKALTYIFAFSLCTGCLTGQEQEKLSQEQVEFFENKIRPSLSKYCYECHSEETGKTKGGLLVDTRVGLLQGGDTAPAVVPGDLKESLFWDAVSWLDSDFEMPPKQKMPDSVVEDFRKWILMGAPDPRVTKKVVVESTIDIEEGRKHWAFQQPRDTKPPALKDQNWESNGIDKFILAKLEANDLKPDADAGPASLLRRIYFDLIGLPPKPEEVQAFLKAWETGNPEAIIGTKVDELLARPQFGERWGRHWMDVARYAESTGMDVNFTYPTAWRYRDYVIDSFNTGKPYDQFLREQIAGDLLPASTDEKWRENLIATGFLAIGTKGLNQPNPRKFQMDLVDEQINTVSQAILGITVSCARCHDHKFDPVSTTDYYALAGIFQSTDTYYGTFSGAQNKRPTDLLILPVADTTPVTKSYSAEEVEELKQEIETMRSRMTELRSSGGQGMANIQKLRLRTRNQISKISQILRTLNPDGSPKPLAMGVQDSENTGNAHVLIRGEVEKPAQEVERGFLQVLNFTGDLEIKGGQSGRRELADWLTSKQNPLTARVMVNRIWQQIMGKGLVTTPNNWGITGQPPSHPELLDYLAIRFMDSDWSIKTVIRGIMLSRTYRLSSEYDEKNFTFDPENRMHWRTASRQLDAEALRDSMLAVSGRIDFNRPVGSKVILYEGARAERRADPESYDLVNYRSVYLPVIRDMLPVSMALFDFPDPSETSAKRSETNMPSQALFLMNSKFINQQAEAMAQNLVTQFRNTEERIRAAFVLAYGRPASPEEVQGCSRFFQQFDSLASQKNPGSDSNEIEQMATEAFCQTLLSSAEFRILN